MVKFNLNKSDLDRNIKTIRKSIMKLAKDLAFEIFFGVKRQTPKDTGKAEAGWMLRRLGNGSYRIFNNVIYIGQLDNGSSMQAPDGIVDPVLNKVMNKRRKL